jgi:hypothetical protein
MVGKKRGRESHGEPYTKEQEEDMRAFAIRQSWQFRGEHRAGTERFCAEMRAKYRPPFYHDREWRWQNIARWGERRFKRMHRAPDAGARETKADEQGPAKRARRAIRASGHSASESGPSAQPSQPSASAATAAHSIVTDISAQTHQPSASAATDARSIAADVSAQRSHPSASAAAAAQSIATDVSAETSQLSAPVHQVGAFCQAPSRSRPVVSGSPGSTAGSASGLETRLGEQNGRLSGWLMVAGEHLDRGEALLAERRRLVALAEAIRSRDLALHRESVELTRRWRAVFDP